MPSKVIIIDYGSQVTQLIARRVREAGVYSEIHPCVVTAAQVKAMQPSAIILSGGPASVGEKDIYKMYRSAKQQVRKLAEDKIRLFSCQNTDHCWEASDCGIYAGNCGKRA